MNWAERRKLTYIALVFLVLGLIAYGIFRQITSVTPTCYDLRRNGDEKGVDCGGTCLQYCPNELANPKVRWVRTFQMTSTVAQSIAYIEHNNATAGAQLVGYTFKLYDEKNTLIIERKGTTFLGPMGRTAIVETLIPTGNVTVARTTLTFTDPIVWEKIPSSYSQVVVKTDRTLIEPAETGTRLIATLENTARYNFSNVDVVAILYDREDNAITASKVLVPQLPALATQTVNFTWPFALPREAFRTEIVVRFNPFTAQTL
ncbi:MAG TPA: hypothetical protein VGE18_00315 [Candidatus Paceibacterota bacterium]